MKYGFVYIWRDRKYSKYYIGRHWGTEDDGYICSNNNMRQNHHNRPEDFTRKIVSKIYTCLVDLVGEEQRWLDMIKPEEFGEKYYNKSPNAKAPSMNGRKHSKETKEKMRQSALCRGDEYKKKMRQIAIERGYQPPSRKGTIHTVESKKKNSDWHLERVRSLTSNERSEKFGGHHKGTHWWNNGSINRKDTKCPKGFVLGRII